MICECGCNEAVTPDSRGRPRRFINGHNAKVQIRRVKRWEDYPLPMRDDTTGCLRWQGQITPSGYGRIGRSTYAHVEAYRRIYGPIPEGHQVDHVWLRGCRYRDCIEPTHLEAVTVAENNRRQPQHVERRKAPHCHAGHAYDERNLRLDSEGRRWCRECNRLNQARYRRNHRCVSG